MTMRLLSIVVLSGCQWTNLKDIHNYVIRRKGKTGLFYQDFTEQFEGYTQPALPLSFHAASCYIRISMNNLKDIHNMSICIWIISYVVLSGCQWTILLQKYKKSLKSANLLENILILQKKVLPLHQQIWRIYTIRIIPLCKHSEWHASVALFHSLPLYLTLYPLHQPHSLQKMTRIMHFFASKLAYTNKKQ